MAMLGGKPMSEWIEQYGHSHQNRINQLCHTIGIPMIAVSVLLVPVAFLRDGFWIVPATMFVVGWVFQFIGHAVEGQPPEFFKDWRFLFVGLRWWFKKVGF